MEFPALQPDRIGLAGKREPAGRISDPETLSKYSTYSGEPLNIEPASKQYKRHTRGNRYPTALKDIFSLEIHKVYL